jgi:hypothetical protein
MISLTEAFHNLYAYKNQNISYFSRDFVALQYFIVNNITQVYLFQFWKYALFFISNHLDFQGVGGKCIHLANLAFM